MYKPGFFWGGYNLDRILVITWIEYSILIILRLFDNLN